MTIELRRLYAYLLNPQMKVNSIVNDHSNTYTVRVGYDRKRIRGYATEQTFKLSPTGIRLITKPITQRY